MIRPHFPTNKILLILTTFLLASLNITIWAEENSASTDEISVENEGVAPTSNLELLAQGGLSQQPNQSNEADVISITFDATNFEYEVSLSNGNVLEYEALEVLFDSNVTFERLSEDSFRFANGDHYGNQISMYFQFDASEGSLYLTRIEGEFPFKQDAQGRKKYCSMGGLNRDIRVTTGEELFAELNLEQNCELK